MNVDCNIFIIRHVKTLVNYVYRKLILKKLFSFFQRKSSSLVQISETPCPPKTT